MMHSLGPANPSLLCPLIVFLLLVLLVPPHAPQAAIRLSDDLQGLRLVHLVYRHGDRTPISPYPTDPYKDLKYWPIGYGQLTNEGKLRHYNLGQWIRNRYTGFLSESYVADEIFVRSTDVDRTLMSAESNLAGLFPPTDQQQWNDRLDWQPVPVHTVPQSEDDLLSSHADCPRFTELQEQLVHSEDFRQMYLENKQLFDYISNNTGLNLTNIVDLEYVYDTLYIEKANNLTLPNWTKPVFPGGKFQELRDLSFTVDTYTKELKRLKGGPFLKKILKDTFAMVDGSLEPMDRKMFMYSGHDTTVAPILHTLGVFNPPVAPAYASMILFEVLERNQHFYIRMAFKNETHSPPYSLTLPGCELLCEINKFKELVTPMLPVDWRSECGLTNEGGVENTVIIIACMASSVMATAVFLSVCALLCKRNKEDEQDVRYERIKESDGP